jgi:hypothetical protein
MKRSIPNPVAGTPAPEPPRRPDGTAFRYELITLTEGTRSYADGLDELVDALISGYSGFTAAEKKRARRQLAEGLRPRLQASLISRFGTAACDSAQRKVLFATEGPVKLAAWTGPVPLVLVSAWYAPEGQSPRPKGRVATPEHPAGIVWLETDSERALLDSLAAAGLVVLSERVNG